MPTSYKKKRAEARKRKNHSPERMAQPYLRTDKKARGDDSESGEEYFDGTDMNIKQSWQQKRFMTFYDRKVAAG